MSTDKIKVKPDLHCKVCHGCGYVYDSVPWGSTYTLMPSLCDCVLEQLSEDDDDKEIEIEKGE